MPATNAFETEILQLIFENIAFAGIGDGGGLLKSAADGVFHFSLSTGSLGETSTQATTEIAYTSYARKDVARGAATWTVAASNVENQGAITFAAGTGGSGTAIDVGLGDDLTGVGALHFYGALDSSLVTGSGVTPEFADTALNYTVE